MCIGNGALTARNSRCERVTEEIGNNPLKTARIGVETVDGEMRMDTIKGILIWTPFDERKTIKHWQNTNIDPVVLKIRYIFLKRQYFSDVIIELPEFSSITNGRALRSAHFRVDGTSKRENIICQDDSTLSKKFSFHNKIVIFDIIFLIGIDKDDIKLSMKVRKTNIRHALSISVYVSKASPSRIRM